MTEDNDRLSKMYEMMVKVKKPAEELQPSSMTKGNFEYSFSKHERIREEEMAAKANQKGWKNCSDGATVSFNADNTLRYKDQKNILTNATTLKRLWLV